MEDVERYVCVGSTKTQLPPAHSRRYSISSNEDHGDLEASLASLHATTAAAAAAEHNHQQYNTLSAGTGPTTAGSGRGGSSSRSPMRAARVLASKIFSKDAAPAVPDTIWNGKSNYAWDIQLLFKRRITNLYLTATSLRSYVELNYSGFRKILKK